MKILTGFAYIVVSLCGAYIGSVLSGDMASPVAASDAGVKNRQARIVRFSKHYACQSTDKACLHNGMVRFGTSGSAQ